MEISDEITRFGVKEFIKKSDLLWSIEHTLNDDFFCYKEEIEERKLLEKQELENKKNIKIKHKKIVKPDMTFKNPKWYKTQLRNIFKRREKDFRFKSEYCTITFDGEFKGKKFTWQELILKDDYERMQSFPQMWNRYYRKRVEQQYLYHQNSRDQDL